MNPSDHERNDLRNGAPAGAHGPTHTNGGPGDGRWLRSVIEHSTEVVKIVAPDGTLRYASPAFGLIFGHDPEEAVGTNVLEYVHPDDLARVLEETEKALSGDGVGRSVAEYRFRHKDGSWRWVESVGTYLLDDPDVRGVVVTVRDVTERKRTEEALKESEERHRIQSRELSLLHHVRSALTQALALPTVFCEVVEAVAETYGYTQVSAYMLEGEDLLLQHQVGYERVIERIPLTEGVSGRTVRTGRPVLLEDVRSDPGFLGAIEGITSEICVPLFDEGQAVGCFNVESTGGVKLTQKDLELMVALGEHASVAVSRARLHTRVKDSEEHFRALTQNSSDLITLLSAVGTIRYQSPAMERILGYRPEETIGSNAFDYIHPDDRERAEMAFAEGLVVPERRPSVEYRFRHKDGRWVWLESVGSNLLDDPGVGEYVVNSRDVTGRKEAEEALKDAEERYRAVVEEQTELVCRFLPDLTLTFVNDAYCRYFGQTPDELLGRTFMEHIPSEDHPYYEGQLSGLGQRNPTRTVEHRVFAPSGEVRWQQWTDTAVFDGGRRIVEYQSVGRDVTERRALEERLKHQALHDSLTGLPNRGLFVDRLGHALARTRRRRGRRVAVLYMDLDGFKVINDSLGHEAGDLLLVVVADRLRRSLRPEDTLARFGGDEFVVLVEDVDDPGEAVRVAERITGELRRPFTVGGRELYAGASIGIALGDARSKTPEDFVRDADTAMYRAKEEGSDYLLFDPAMYERAVSRLELENDLRRAIEQEEFVVHYQPIISLETDEVWGLEALVRWEHPERGLLDPDKFVPIAEESGLVVPIGEAVLEEACRRAKGWQEERPHVPPLVMSVNLSARQLSRPDLAETVEGVLRSTGFEGNCLCLDVTETVYVRALEGNTRALDRLRNMGVRISIDDFGTGYSSLSYLKRLPADAIKIDKSFVKGLGEDVEDTAIVRMVIELAHTLGVEVVAEGVESRAQAALLAEMGCDMGQGYLFARPLSPEAAAEFLSE